MIWPNKKQNPGDGVSVVHSRKEHEDRLRHELVDEEGAPALTPSEFSESIDLEAEPPLRKPVITDAPADISPQSVLEEHEIGAARHSDAETMAEYEKKAAG